MAIYTLARKQTLNGSIEEVWNFFSSPHNLSKITPPETCFEVLSEVPERMYPGLMIEYRVRPLAGIPMRWLTEITHVVDHQYFADEQRVGPYAIWHHEHHFKVLDSTRVEMEDRITYVPPFGILGAMVHPFVIRPKLEEIFAYREKVARELF